MTQFDKQGGPCANTDRELWREVEGDYYAPSIHVTEGGGVGINVGGTVYVKPLREWHKLAMAKLSAPSAEEPIGEVVGHECAGRALVDWYDNGFRPIGLKLYRSALNAVEPTCDYPNCQGEPRCESLGTPKQPYKFEPCRISCVPSHELPNDDGLYGENAWVPVDPPHINVEAQQERPLNTNGGRDTGQLSPSQNVSTARGEAPRVPAAASAPSSKEQISVSVTTHGALTQLAEAFKENQYHAIARHLCDYKAFISDKPLLTLFAPSATQQGIPPADPVADAIQKDAARYRWLKDNWSTNHGSSTVEWRLHLGHAEVYGFEELVDKGMSTAERSGA